MSVGVLRDSRESGGDLSARGDAVEAVPGGRREVPQRPSEDDCALSVDILCLWELRGLNGTDRG